VVPGAAERGQCRAHGNETLSPERGYPAGADVKKRTLTDAARTKARGAVLRPPSVGQTPLRVVFAICGVLLNALAG
jgi:hypothetical protein